MFLVLAGDSERIMIPALPADRSETRLRGLRLLHTHLTDDGLSQEDLMDLLFLRLDAMACLSVDALGSPTFLQYAELDPARKDPPYTVSERLPFDTQTISLHPADIEAAFARSDTPRADTSCERRAVLVSVSDLPQLEQERNMEELARLAGTAGIVPCATLMQRTARINPRVLLGKGKMAELEVLCLEHNADTLLFDGELTPSQLHNVADLTERTVLDRTQLILDIFAKHARSRAGKLQVELARLRYLQPRLVGRNTHLDRLMGGIGGRGAGETKLEYDRRRTKDRITALRAELQKLREQRAFVRARRKRNNIPFVCIVGYTNAGKSTLLNTLAHADTLVGDRLFATLDPVTRRLRYPREREIVFADTIGFIRNLPAELMEAFQATLEDLEAADLLIHVVDAHDPKFPQQMQSVERILETLDVHRIPRILVFTKWDRVPPDLQEVLEQTYPDAVPVSSVERLGIRELEARVLSHLAPTQSLQDKKRSGEEFSCAP